MNNCLIAVLSAAATLNSALAQQSPVTIHVLSGDSRLQRDGKWSPARLWRVDGGVLTVVAALGSSPAYGVSNRRLVIVSGLASRVEDDLGGGKIQSRLAIRSWNLKSSELLSDQTVESLPGNMLTLHHNRPAPSLNVADGKIPTVYFRGWTDQIIKQAADKDPNRKDPKGDKTSVVRESKTAKVWTLCAIDVQSGKSWAIRGDSDTERIQGPIQVQDRVAFVDPGKSAWFYSPPEHSLGRALALPPSAKEYSAGLGMIERQAGGEFLVTDPNFGPLNEARPLPKPAAQWTARQAILAGDRPLWILMGAGGTGGTEISLFDPVANITLYSKNFEIPFGNFRLQIAPSGLTWFIHNAATNKAILVDAKSNVSIEQDLPDALKGLERPVIVASFAE